MTYTYNKNCSISSVTDWNGRTTTYGYDKNGRLIETKRPNGTVEKREYDKAGQLTLILDMSGDKVVNSQPELSQVLQSKTIENNNEESAELTYFYYGQGLLTQENSKGYLTYHFNNVGSTMAVTDQSGVVTAKYNYSPYGELKEGEYDDNIQFLYNGQYGVTTDDNGLYYMRARYYNVDIKRFINQDVLVGTLERISSLNRYSYVEGNPVSYLDPFGLERWIHEMLHEWVSVVSFYVNSILFLFGLSATHFSYYFNAFMIGFDFGVYINEFFSTGCDWSILIDGFVNTTVNATYFAFGVLANLNMIPKSTGDASELASLTKSFVETLLSYS